MPINKKKHSKLYLHTFIGSLLLQLYWITWKEFQESLKLLQKYKNVVGFPEIEQNFDLLVAESRSREIWNLMYYLCKTLFLRLNNN